MLVEIISLFFYLLNLAIFARIMLSWLPIAGIHIDPYNPIVQLLHQITDPILEPFRQIIPPIGMIDISPIVAIIVLQVIQQVIISMLTAV